MRKLAVLTLLPLIMAGHAANADACTIDITSAPTPAQLVERSALIVHVRAQGYCTGSTRDCAQLSSSVATQVSPTGAAPPASMSSVGVHADGLIDFEVLNVLKGPALPDTVRIPGRLTRSNDFNDGPVPYTFVRPGGQSGNCFAYGYRAGAEYLLFLRPAAEAMTPYWAPLAAINEQVRSADDRWIKWVREQLIGKPPQGGRPGAR